MDGKHFDDITKIMASWMSRRRLLLRMSSGGAAVIATRTTNANAQTVGEADCIASVDPRANADMGPQGGPSGSVAQVIRSISSDAYTILKDARDFTPPDLPNYPNNGIRFDEYVQAIKCIAEQGTDINVDASNVDRVVGSIISQLNGVNASLSIAYFAVRPPAMTTADNLYAFQTPPVGECHFPACFESLFAEKGSCEGTCVSRECFYRCRLKFATDLITKPDSENLGKSCLQGVQEACGTGCCGGVCKKWP